MHAGMLGHLLLIFIVLFQPVAARSAETPENVCLQCHGAMTGRTGEPVKLWRGSIHAENGISCNGCHGGDPKDAANAMSPERGFLGVPKATDIPAFCGRCHLGVMKDFQASGHGRALGKGGPTCVTCHGNHQVVKATPDLINEKSCSRCHGFERAKEVKSAMQETERLISSLDDRIAGYKKIGGDVDRLEKGLFSLRNRFHSLFHSVDVEKVKKESAQITTELKKLEAAVTEMDTTRQKRKVAGAVAVAAALAAALLFHLLGRTYHDR